MSGKRRQVLQMGSASKLHRYGYSKEFHSKNKKGKGTVTSLVGEFSDTESDDNGDVDELANGDVQEEEEENVTSGLPTLSGDFVSAPALSSEKLDGVAMPENPADMDDELKNFLSEIEAIPMPTNGNEHEVPIEPDTNVEVQSEPVQEVQKPIQEVQKPAIKARPSNNHYSMFVKGESEFVHSPKAAENSQIEPKEEDFPEEPTTNWQMVQDEHTEYYYYWNMVTNEVTWEIPTDYTQFLLLHREYVEKIAKYTPEQRDKLKEKHTKTTLKDPGVRHLNENLLTSGTEVKQVESQRLVSTVVHGPERRPQKALSDAQQGSRIARGVSPSKRLSPLPETGQESRHKHKKEKRSHHKKKHKRKHGDQLSDEEKHSPKTTDVSQPLLPPQSSATIVPGYKLLSIVPYLSDQDDSDEDENPEPVPQLGRITSSIAESKIEKEPAQGDPLECGLSPSSTSADILNLIMNEAPQPEVLSQITDATFPTALLLLPPPPPPPSPPQEKPMNEDLPVIDNIITQTVDEHLPGPSQDPTEYGPSTNSEMSLINLSTFTQFNHSTVEQLNHSTAEQFNHITVEQSNNGTVEQFNQSAVEQLGDKVVNELISAIVDPIESKHLTEYEPNALINTRQDPTIVTTNNGKGAQKSKHFAKEVIDMFSEHFPLPIPSQGKQDVLMDKSSGGTDILLQEVTKAVEPPEEVMEEGEILELPEKETAVPKEKHSVSVRSRQIFSEKNRNETGEQKVLKSVNIVGYASDDEEEEGEVRDKVVKKEVKREEKLPSHKEKRKKEKKRESKKHGKNTEADLALRDKKVDMKKVAPLNQEIPKIVSQDVVDVAVKKPEIKDEQDDDDVEFDLDDIDRALEVALEKKLDKKKVDMKAKVIDKESMVKDEITSSLDVAAKQVVTTVTISPALGLVTEEVNADKDSQSDATKKPLQDSVQKDEMDDSTCVIEVKAMAELALSKLEFLDISTDNLSQLQVLFIELQTRHTDWTAGGLSTQYFYNQLKIAEGLLEQYELNAVPSGWACQWDRDNNRYYYRNVLTNRIQWEYPDVQSAEKTEPQVVAVVNNEPVGKVRTRGSEEHRRSRGSGGSGRSKKNDDKEKSKHDRRSSSRHYHRKRRRGRDQSNSSNSSVDSQQHRHHRKSKKKKKQHRAERSPSVEIVECIDMVDVDEIEDSPNNLRQPNSPSNLHQPNSPSLALSDSPTASVPPDAIIPPDVATTEDLSQPPMEAAGEEVIADINTAEEAAEIRNNPVVISKPPQILIHPSLTTGLGIIHPSLTTGMGLDVHLPSDLYSNPQVGASTPVAFYPSYATAQPVADLAIPSTEMAAENNEASLETDKGIKKKKKDKKPLATGSSIMMKKKHMSTMVQKWQKVKIEVEKEDLAKELRQAAIRKKIEELKNSDKPS